MMKDQFLEVSGLPEELQRLIAGAEVAGQRARFLRGNREIALLIASDEYLALRETTDLSDDPDLISSLASADIEAEQNSLILPEDLFGE